MFCLVPESWFFGKVPPRLGLYALLGASLTVSACGSTGDRTATVGPPTVRALKRLVLSRHGHQLVRFGDRLLLIGGAARGPLWKESRVQCLEYDLQTGDKVRRGDLNRGKSFFVARPVDGALLAASDVLESYDFNSHAWAILPVSGGSLPSSHFSATSWKGRLYTLGGFPESAASFRSLDPLSGAMRLEPPMPDLRPGDHFHIMETLSDGIHVVGGLEGSGGDLRSEHWLFDGDGWHQLRNAPLPVERKFSAVAVVADQLYIFDVGSGLRYGTAGGSWERLDAMPARLADSATFVWGPLIHVIGGLPTDAAPATYVFDTDEGEWQTLRR